MANSRKAGKKMWGAAWREAIENGNCTTFITRAESEIPLQDDAIVCTVIPNGNCAIIQVVRYPFAEVETLSEMGVLDIADF